MQGLNPTPKCKQSKHKQCYFHIELFTFQYHDREYVIEEVSAVTNSRVGLYSHLRRCSTENGNHPQGSHPQFLETEGAYLGSDRNKYAIMVPPI